MRVGGASGGTASAVGGLTVTYSPTAGNTVVLGIQIANTGKSIPTDTHVEDSAAHTYVDTTDCSIIGPFNDGSGSLARSYLVVIPNIGSGITSFTLAFLANIGRALHINEFSGRVTSLATIVNANAHASDAATPSTSLPGSTAQVTPSVTGCDLVEHVVFGASISAPTGGASGGGTYTQAPVATARCADGYVENVGTGTYSAAMSWTTSANWIVTTVALAPSAAPSTHAPPPFSKPLRIWKRRIVA